MATLSGKTVLVTGATNGIGLEAAVTFAREGATVVMVGRDAGRTAAALEEVTRRAPGAVLESLLCDFASQKQVRALAAAFLAKHQRLDLLVNNAGTVHQKRWLTEDGIEATFAVNHLGYFLLTNLLLDVLVKSAPAKVVSVASATHRDGTMNFADLGFEQGGYSIMKAYGRSKLGNVLFTRELAKRLASKNVTVNCLHPGGVATNIWSHAPGWTQPVLAVLKRLLFISAEEGGRTITHVALSPELAGKTGLYFEKNQPVEPSPLARDEALASRLWDVSAKLVGLAG